MQKFNHILFDFVESLFGTSDPGLMFVALEKAIKDAGYDYVSFTLIPGVVLSEDTDYVPVFQLSEEYDDQLIEYHVKDIVSIYKDLNVLKRNSTYSDVPIKECWEDELQKSDDINDELTLKVARYEHGISKGISILTYNDGYNFAGVSVYSEGNADNFWTQYNEKIDFLKKISIIYSDRVIGIAEARQLFYSPFLAQLTSTERDVLHLMSKGDTVQNISHQLTRDYKYIANKILPSIRMKMGGVSRDRMMYFVGKMYIDPN